MTIWNLNTLVKPGEQEALIQELRKNVSQFKTVRNQLNDSLSPEKFIEVLKNSEHIIGIASTLGAHAQLWLSENTGDSQRITNHTKISQLGAEISNDLLFFNLWFKDLPDDKAEKYISHSGNYRYYLQELRRFKPHTLNEKEEQIINFKDLTGTDAFVKIYDLITNKYNFTFEGKEITQEEINQYKQSADRKKRIASYDLVLNRYGKEEDVLGETYKNIVNDWRNENITLRGYSSPISVRNLYNDVSDEAIKALLAVIRRNIGLFQEYFTLKAKLCKLESMDRYDLYAPYSPTEKEYSYDQSKKIVLETYKEFDENAHDMAKKIFDDGHVHSDVTPGKRSGAFCYTILKDITPYIMLNHVGKLKDVFTMAHEFGHGIHGMSAHEQTDFTFHSALPLAETASIFGEMLLSQRLLKQADNEEKIAILVRNLDSQYASIARQAYFILFEIDAHEKISKGATVEELNELYLNNLKEQFGSMPVAEVFKHEWKYIPHIYHTPFYCYAYAFGNLLVLALYKMYEEQGKDFVPKYMKILSYGGSESPHKILEEVGIDITKEEFWQQGFDTIKEEIDELRKLTS